eukprot:Pgem_evm1s16063
MILSLPDLNMLKPSKGIVVAVHKNYGHLRCEGFDPKQKVVFHDPNIAAYNAGDEVSCFVLKDKDVTSAINCVKMPAGTVQFE